MNESKARVLIVDDEKTNISILVDVLKKRYKLSIATNGEEALAIVQTGDKPDLILLDVMMPGMDGFEVCRRLKAEAESEEIPIIFVTALSDSTNEELGLALGAVDYITKPISPPVVLLRIKLHLELHRYREFLELLMKQRTEALEETRNVLDFLP